MVFAYRGERQFKNRRCREMLMSCSCGDYKSLAPRGAWRQGP